MGTDREQKAAGWAWTGHRQGGLLGEDGGRKGEIWGPLQGFLGTVPLFWALISRPLWVGGALPLWRTSHGARGPRPDRSAASTPPRSRTPGAPRPPRRLSPTCLLGLAPGRRAPRPVPRGVEGRHADHVGGVASQVLEFDAVLGQEKRLHPFREVPPLGLPEINLWAQRIWSEGDSHPASPLAPA